MKTLERILIILLAATIVVGGMNALLQTSTAQALAGQPLGSGSENGTHPAPSEFANGQGASTGEMRGGSWETVGRNLLEIAAIVAAVQGLWSIGRWMKRTSTSRMRKNRLSLNRS